MIDVSLTTAFMIYLCMTLGTLLALWAWQHNAARKKKIAITERQITICEYCKYCYLKKVDRKISRCPQCLSFNNQQ